MKKWMLIAQLLLAVVAKAEVGKSGHIETSSPVSQITKPAPTFPKDTASSLRPGTGPCAVAPGAASSTGSSSLPSFGY